MGIFDESVNGTIIGDVTFPYQFWTEDGNWKIDSGFFENDEAAIEWFKNKYPAEFKAGVEMRVFDK